VSSGRESEGRLRILVWLLYLACRAGVLLRLGPDADIRRYFAAARVLPPYKDHPLEYPPGGFVLFLIPRLLIDDLGGYTILFAAQMLLWDLLIMWVLGRIPRVISAAGPRRHQRTLVQASYVIITFLLGSLLVTRFDVVLAGLMLCFIYRVLIDRRRWLADLLLATAIWVKLGAGALVLPYLVYLHRQDTASADHGLPATRRWLLTQGLARLGCILGFTALLFVPFLFAAGASLFSFVSYHAARGLQIESSYASVLLLLERFTSSGLQIEHNFGAWHLRHWLSSLLASASIWITIGSQLLLTWWFGRRIAAAETVAAQRRLLLTSAFIFMLALLFTSKVFSPQFLIWLAPLAALLVVSLERRRIGGALLQVLAVYVFSAALCWFFYRGLIRMELGAVVLLLLRNALIPVLATHLLRTDPADHAPA
jgi:hypothetical protein